MTDIAELEAYVAIRHVKARYCRTLDYRKPRKSASR